MKALTKKMKAELTLELAARRAQMMSMHSKPGLSMVKYMELAGEVAKLEKLLLKK